VIAIKSPAQSGDIWQSFGYYGYAYDRGVRYFDTARVYEESESIVGRGLKDVRKDAFIATKVAVYSPHSVRKSLETSLDQLGTDYIDLAQIHSPTIEAIGFRGAMKIHAELLKLRDEKLFRFIGLTTHVAFEDVYKMVSTGGFDQVLLAYGYFRKGMDTLLSHRNLEWRALCLAKAHEHNAGKAPHCVMLFVIAEKEELFDNADHGILAHKRAKGPKKLVVVEGIQHYGIYRQERARAQRLAIEWYDEHLKK
jgi:hypothetical protein